MGISINGPSGIDTAYIIESLVALEYSKVDRVKVQQNDYQIKIDAYTKLLNLVKDIGSRANSLKNEEDFDIFKTNSSNEEIVTFDTSAGGVAGSYDIQVFQKAQREKLVSSNNLITDQSASLTSLGIAAGSFSINGVEITLDADDTIQDLRMKINNATDGNGDKAGVTATVLKISDNNFRLVLSQDETGSDGAAYQDLHGGTTLQDLGIITNAAGDKDLAAQTLQSVDDLNAAFSALAIGATIEYGGFDHDGNSVSNSFIVTATSTIDDFLSQVSDTYHGMAEVSIDGSGILSITDKTKGASDLAMTSLVMDGTGYAVNRTIIGNSGQNVLSVGKDAFFSIDSINLQSDKNQASGYISGVNLEFHKASYDETATISMERDFDAIADKVDELLNAYNAVLRYVKSSTQHEDEEEGEKGGSLAGDMTASSILSQIKGIFQKNFDVTGSSDYDTLTMVGIKTDINSGEFKLDRTDFKEALSESFNEVTKLFITYGYSDNPNITMGTYSENTQDGVYSLIEVDPNQYSIEKTNPPTPGVELSEPRQGDIISFTKGPAMGLSITAPVASGNAVFTFSKGLSGHLDEMIENLTDGQDGVISLRQKSWRSAQGRLDDRILSLESRVESYRLRLVKQFAAMEQTLSQLNAQSSNMMSQLGLYTQQQ